MMPRWTPALDDYIDIATYLLGADSAAIRAIPTIALAESALHAPFASFFWMRTARSGGPPDPDTDAAMVEQIAASQVAREAVVEWVRRRTGQT